MKILYIGTNKEASGWGEASRHDLMVLDSEFDVVSRPMVYSGGVGNKRLDELEKKSLDGVTHVIQYCLPSQWQRYGTMKHIGYVEIESCDLSRSRWVDNFSVVDEIWCPNKDGCRAIEAVWGGPVVYMPHAIDTSVYKNSYKISKISEVSGTFKFLCVSENVPRKNLSQLIEEFWIEFDPTEPVSLILKTNASIADVIRKSKEKLKLYNTESYQKIMVIDDRLNHQEMMGLYNYCDCYVNPSMGESWCLPVVHAAGFNKPVITIDSGGPADILSGYEKLFQINDFDKFPCESNNNIPGYQTGMDYWYKPSHLSIGTSMRFCYTFRPDDNEEDILSKFSDQEFINRVKLTLNPCG